MQAMLTGLLSITVLKLSLPFGTMNAALQYCGMTSFGYSYKLPCAFNLGASLFSHHAFSAGAGVMNLEQKGSTGLPLHSTGTPCDNQLSTVGEAPIFFQALKHLPSLKWRGVEAGKE
jgi:hypothetical protein